MPQRVISTEAPESSRMLMLRFMSCQDITHLSTGTQPHQTYPMHRDIYIYPVALRPKNKNMVSVAQQ